MNEFERSPFDLTEEYVAEEMRRLDGLVYDYPFLGHLFESAKIDLMENPQDYFEREAARQKKPSEEVDAEIGEEQSG